MSPRLAIITTHPIQYNAPLFQLLAKQSWLDIKVFYTWSQRKTDLFDEKFGKEVKWDLPLQEGYDYTFVENMSSNPGSNAYNGIDCPSLIKEVKEWDASHLLVFGWNFKSHLKVIRFFSGKIPILFRGDSTMVDMRDGSNRLIRRTGLRWVYRKVNYALYVGKANKVYYRVHGLANKQLLFAPHAIDNNRFALIDDVQIKQLNELKALYKLTEEDKVILFVGKFENKKNPLILLRAFQELCNENIIERIKLLYVGDGDLQQALKNAAEGNERIIFLDFQNQNQMPIIYRLADVLCLPSSGPGETWGLVVNEAMACGLKCVVSNKVGSAADLGTYPGNHVFKSSSVEDLKDKLQKAFQESALNNADFLATYNYESIIHAIQQIIL